MVKNSLFAVAVFIAYSFILFKKQGSVLDNTYILSDVLLLVVLGGR